MSSVRVRLNKKVFEQREKEDLDRKVAPLIEQQSKMLAEIRAKQNAIVNQYYSGSIEELFAAPAETAPVDSALLEQVPTTTKRDIEAEKAGFYKALEQLKTTRGYSLSPNAQNRLGVFGQVHSLYHADFSKVESWLAAFQRLWESQSFSADEVTYRASDIIPVAPAPEPEPAMPTLGDIDKIDTSTRDGAEKARDIANKHLWGVEARNMMNEFRDHMVKVFQYHLTAADEKRIIEKFLAEGWNWLDRRNWDSCRLWLCRQGFWNSDAFMTEAEKLNEELEATDLSQLPHNQRVALNTRLRQVRQ